MSVNIGGLVSVAIFYALILIVGIWAGWKQKQKLKTATEGIMLAGRDIGLFVGVLTMTGTSASSSTV
jgi:predicted hotdog family 3-hydroxylacyl-ACP dehydratase